ncbi:MAG: nuclear transport factor 2 family protein [Candidatus Dormiibacterota bacterium]
MFERTQRQILERRFSEYADAFAADGVFELPFAPAGLPRRIEGREQIRAFLMAASERMGVADRTWTFDSVAFHGTTDPEVIVTEFDVSGRDPAAGRSYRFANLQVRRVRAGEILSLRDYWNPLDRPELAALIGQR